MQIRLILILAMLIGQGTFSFSQYKNIKIGEQGDSLSLLCEPAIAINPRYPNNIVAIAVPQNVSYTKDAGKTWKKSSVTSPHGVFGNPALVADEKGNFYYFHLSDPAGGTAAYETEKLDRIVVQKSEDGGETWSPGQSIGINQPKDQHKEWATTDSKGNLYVAWTQFDKYGDADPACQSNILFSMSKNGKKWTEPIVISQYPGNCIDNDSTTVGAVPAVTYDGKAFIAWSNQGQIFLDRSFDGGEMWLNNDIAVTDKIGGDLKIPGHVRANGMPVLVTDNSRSPYRGSLYIVWADQTNGDDDTDIWVTRSHNFGDNWSTPTRVNNDGKGKHQYLPWIAVDQTTGHVYVVYYDRRDHDDNQTDVYLAYSTDGGAKFKNVKISESPFTPQEDRSFADKNNISAHKGLIIPVWTRMDDGKASIWTAVIRQEELK